MTGTYATTQILAGPTLSPQPPMPPVRLSLEVVDWVVYLIEERLDDPDADPKPTRLGHVGCGWTVDQVPAELRRAYDRLVYAYEAEIEEIREARREADFDRAFRDFDYTSTRGL